jgi:histidinol-phosphate aminotransferase
MKPVYVNPNIRDTYRIFPEQGRYAYHRFDLNENPEGLPVHFVEEVKKNITPEFLSTYPEPKTFIEKYANSVNVHPENILPTNGSDMAIRYVLETFGESGKDIVTVSPTFGMYAVNCSILGLRHKPIAYNSDLTFDIQKLLNAIDSDTRVVAILNPNNPVGDAFNSDELDAVVAKAETVGAIVVIDEAYHYFYDKTCIEYTMSKSNVILLRTFSKLFSIAACRLGVIISNPQLIQYINNGRLTFDVNSIALLFGEKILDDPRIEADLIRTEKEGKDFLSAELDKRNYEYVVCKGNFILIIPKSLPAKIEESLCVNKQVLIHTFGKGLLEQYIRVSVGSIRSMRIFADAFFSLDGNL